MPLYSSICSATAQHLTQSLWQCCNYTVAQMFVPTLAKSKNNTPKSTSSTPKSTTVPHIQTHIRTLNMRDTPKHMFIFVNMSTSESLCKETRVGIYSYVQCKDA